MLIRDTSSMIDGFTIALLTAELGQVWAKLGLQKSRATLGDLRTSQLCSCRQRIN